MADTKQIILSVILCSHNPSPPVLQRTLAALKAQTMPKERWELLLIDNASNPPINASMLAGLPNARIILEAEVGLTSARLRGIRESAGNLLVFVDDDNVLAPSYLDAAAAIHHERSYIGAFGGTIKPIFEVDPPSWTRPYWYLLAIRETPTDRWGHLAGNAELEPCGAGLCVCPHVAHHYLAVTVNDPLRKSLDRRGGSLSSAGDMDLIACALDLDMAIGRFRALELEHIIPPHRLTSDYLLRLFEAMHYSGEALKLIRGSTLAEPAFVNRNVTAQLRRLLRRCTMSPFDRRMMDAAERGQVQAHREFKQLKRELRA